MKGGVYTEERYYPLQDLIRRVLDACAGARRILDCGSGLEAPYQFGLQKRAERLVLLDAHGPYLQANQTRGPNVERFQGFLPGALSAFPDETFDAAVCIDVLEHLSEANAGVLVAELKRVARKVVLFTPDGVNEQDTDNYLMDADGLQTHRSTWSVEKLQALGFRAQVMHPDFHGPGLGALWAVAP
ncbi:MAG: class I SAM-dependent methyltransferase [Candidatus Omnitrophica bacterium]|nr:class I SAM-dependent methyltransferase [Candidatus Omnitrophota bacterium]